MTTFQTFEKTNILIFWSIFSMGTKVGEYWSLVTVLCLQEKLIISAKKIFGPCFHDLLWKEHNYYWITSCIRNQIGRFQTIVTYSWSRIFLGNSNKGPLGKLVLEKISATFEFLHFSSPSLPPEARWLHTKQKLASCNWNLTDTEPCKLIGVENKIFS